MKRHTTISVLALAVGAISAAPAAAQAPTPPTDPTQPPPPTVQQRVVISGVPSGCMRRSSFVARISLQPATPPMGTRGNSSIRVTLDRNRVLRTTAQASFGVRVPVSTLRPGLHRIGVSVTSRAGNLEELRGARRFRRCR